MFCVHIVIKMYSVWKQLREGQPDLQLFVTEDIRVLQELNWPTLKNIGINQNL